MGLFDKFKKKEINNKEYSNENDIYVASPKIYQREDAKPLGVLTLTEQVTTLLPKDPRNNCNLGDIEVEEWQLMFVILNKNGSQVLSEIDYYEAIKKLMKFAIKEDDKSIVIKGLSKEEFQNILQ